MSMPHFLIPPSLFNRIIYPHSYADFKEAGHTDEDLMEILTHVHLAYLPEREGGWSTQKEWRDVLSGGEKQRVSIFSSHDARYSQVGIDGDSQTFLSLAKICCAGRYASISRF